MLDWTGRRGGRETRAGQSVRQKDCEERMGWVINDREGGPGVALPWGLCVLDLANPRGNDELSAKPGRSAQASRKIHLTTSRISLHIRPWWDFSIGPRVWKCWPFSLTSEPPGNLLYEVIAHTIQYNTWGIAQISLFTIMLETLEQHMCSMQNTHMVSEACPVWFRFNPGFILCSFSGLSFWLTCKDFQVCFFAFKPEFVLHLQFFFFLVIIKLYSL